MTSKLTWFERVARAWHRNSLTGFFALVLYNLRMLITGRYREHSHLFNDAFDLEFKVETRGTEEPEYLTGDAQTKRHARRYEAVTVEQMSVLMDKLQSLNFSKFTFVDVGSGKGRALFIAANFSFRKIIGIEFARELHETAVRNISTYRNPAQKCFKIESICADATTFTFPVTPTVCFMNNPFDEVLVEKLIHHLSNIISASPREFFLIYLHSNHPGVVDHHGAWTRLCDGLIPPHTPYVIWKWQNASS